MYILKTCDASVPLGKKKKEKRRDPARGMSANMFRQKDLDWISDVDHNTATPFCQLKTVFS